MQQFSRLCRDRGMETIDQKDSENDKKTSKLTVRAMLELNVLWFSLNAQSAALLPIVIPTQILLFVAPGEVGNAQQAQFLGLLTTVASVVSLFMPPIIGTLSDSTRNRFGRRRLYIGIGGLLLVISTLFLAESTTIIIFLVGLAILHLGKNILSPAYQSLIPDQVPKKQRGKASGYVGAMTLLGNVASLLLAALLLGNVHQHASQQSLIRSQAGIYYIVTAIAIAIAVLITALGVHEAPFLPPRSTSRATGQRLSQFWRWFAQNWLAPWHSFNFTVVFLTRAFIMLGLTLFMTYIEYYFAQVQHITNFVEVTAVIAVLALGGGVVSGLVFGILSDRLPRRAPIVCFSTLGMSLAAFAFVIIPNDLMFWLWPLGVLFGLGHGAYTSVDWALSIDALPSLDNAGKDMGLWNASTTLPAIVGPLLGSFIITLAGNASQTALGYRFVFLAATICLFVAAFAVLLVREQKKTAKK